MPHDMAGMAAPWRPSVSRLGAWQWQRQQQYSSSSSSSSKREAPCLLVAASAQARFAAVANHGLAQMRRCVHGLSSCPKLGRTFLSTSACLPALMTSTHTDCPPCPRTCRHRYTLDSTPGFPAAGFVSSPAACILLHCIGFCFAKHSCQHRPPLPTTHCPLPTTHCPLPTAHLSLPLPLLVRGLLVTCCSTEHIPHVAPHSPPVFPLAANPLPFIGHAALRAVSGVETWSQATGFLTRRFPTDTQSAPAVVASCLLPQTPQLVNTSSPSAFDSTAGLESGYYGVGRIARKSSHPFLRLQSRLLDFKPCFHLDCPLLCTYISTNISRPVNTCTQIVYLST
jgi:hypothetical protein